MKVNVPRTMKIGEATTSNSSTKRVDKVHPLKPDQTGVLKPDQTGVLKPDQTGVLKPDQKPDQTGVCRKVVLVLTPPTSGHPPGDATLAVYRQISHVTRVSNRKIRKYIYSAASLVNKPLSLHLLLALVRQTFAEKEALPKTSVDLLHCQVVYCLKFDPNFALNPAEQTFCLSVACKTSPPSLESVMQDVHSDEVLEFIAKCFESSSGPRCLGVREIVDKVFFNFRKRLGGTSKSVVALVIQYLLVRSPRLGFTLDGKMALVPDGIEKVKVVKEKKPKRANPLKVVKEKKPKGANPLKVVKEKKPKRANPLLDCSCEELMKIPYNYLMRGGTWGPMRTWFDQVSQSRPKVIEEIVLLHGCFLRYLVMRSRDASPECIGEKLSSSLQTKLNYCVAARISIEGFLMKFEKLLEIFTAGFVDSDFLLESLETNSATFEISGGFVRLLRPYQTQESNLSAAQQGMLDPASDKSEAPGTLDSLSSSVSKILSSKESSETRFRKLVNIFATLPVKLKAEALSDKRSYWNFIVEHVPNWRGAHMIVHHMVKNVLGPGTKAIGHLYCRLFDRRCRLMSNKELENSLKNSEDFVVEKQLQGSFVVCVKRTGANNEPIFSNDCEKRAIMFIMSYFKDGCVRTTYGQLLNFASNSKLLSADLHPILFGARPCVFKDYERKAEMKHSGMFRRFLRMFTTVFTIVGESVALRPFPYFGGNVSISDKSVSSPSSGEFRHRKRRFSDPPHDEEPEMKVFRPDPCSDATVPKLMQRRG